MHRFVLLMTMLILASAGANACPTCRPQVQAGIYDLQWSANAAVLLLPLVVIGGTAALIYFAEPLASRLQRGGHK